MTSDPSAADEGAPPRRVELPDREWRERLSPEQFRIARKKGTERAFTGEYWAEKGSGTYRCVCCGTALFLSTDKYDSGTGWPSFSDVVRSDHVRKAEDRSFLMRRTEVLCAVCDAHLGHVFPDGPEPTGLRYCVNSASLSLDPGEFPGDARESPDPGSPDTPEVSAGPGSSGHPQEFPELGSQGHPPGSPGPGPAGPPPAASEIDPPGPPQESPGSGSSGAEGATGSGDGRA